MASVADLLAPFSEVAGVSVRANASAAVRKRILASLAFVESRERLHEQLFPDEHIDWGAVYEFLGHGAYTQAEWQAVLQLLEFVHEPAPRAAVADLVACANAGVRAGGAPTTGTQASSSSAPTSSSSSSSSSLPGGGGALTPVEAMRVCLARAKIPGVTWDLIGKCMIAANLTELEPTTGLTLVLSPSGATREQISELARCLLTFRHAQADYSETFARLLHPQYCQVRVHVVQEALQQRDQLREQAKKHAARTGDAFRRPCLLDIVQLRQRAEGAGGEASPDTVVGFCRATHLAFNASARLKKILYYLMCAAPDHPERAAQIRRVLGDDAGACARVMQVTVVQPDVAGLCDAIMETQHTGAPSAALREFHQRCANGLCFVGSGRSVHWTAALRLYLAAYLRADAARDVWRHVLERTARHRQATAAQATAAQATAAPESESALQGFVHKHPMALEEAVTHLLAS